MSRTAIALICLVLALAGAAGGWWFGVAHGQAKQQAQQDARLVKDLSQLISSHQGLVASANRASQALRKASGQRKTINDESTQELFHALAPTAASRADCVLPDGGLLILAKARDRAANAAASGTAADLPAASTSAGER